MHAFIAGATGVLGRRLVAELADRGHRVVGLTRDEAGDEAVAARGGEPRRGDVLDANSLVDAAADADVVIHAATAIPTARKPTAEDWRRNDRVRYEGARNLTAAAAEAGAERFLLQSIAWVARRPDGAPFDEEAPPNPDRTTQSALEAERHVRDAGAREEFDVGILRCGWFYGPESAHTLDMGHDLAAGRLPVVGGGLLGRRTSTHSVLHTGDAARAFAAAAEADATGTWHVVDEEPAPLDAFLGALADRVDGPTPRQVPGWLARFVVGRDLVRFLTTSMPTSSDRFRAAVDWEPTYPTYREGLDAVAARWREDGVLEETADGVEWGTRP